MSKQSTYCKCLNKYTVKECDKKDCKTPYYWKHSIGKTRKKS